AFQPVGCGVDGTCPCMCSAVDFTLSPPSPVAAGSSVVVQASAECEAGAQIVYCYRISSQSGASIADSGWTSHPSSPWSTSGLTPDAYRVTVAARGASQPESQTVQREQSFTLLDPAALRCPLATLAVSPASPQPLGTLVDLQATATCDAGAIPEFQF